IERGVRHALLAAADAEKLVAGTGDDHDTRTGFAADRVDAVVQLMAHGLGEHVAVVRPIERDCADRPVLLVEDCLVAHSAAPAMIPAPLSAANRPSSAPRTFPSTAKVCSPSLGGGRRGTFASPSRQNPVPTCGTCRPSTSRR